VSWRDLWTGWNKFWFQPGSVLPMAVFRILLGLHVLQFAWLIYPELQLWYLPDGFFSIPTVVQWDNGARPSLLWMLPQTPESIYSLFLLMVVAAFSLTIGFCSRTSAFLVAVTLISFHHRNGVILNSGDMLLRFSALVLMFSHAGKALSVDSWLKRKLDQPFAINYPIWTQRLVQLQLTAIYADGALSKLDGKTWLDGTAVYYVLRHVDTQRFSIPFVFDNLLICQLLTWGTIAIELALCTLVWVKELRYWVLLGGVMLHTGIEITMNIPGFETMMMSFYIAFVDPRDIAKVIEFAKKLVLNSPLGRWKLRPLQASDTGESATAS
jgi:hypothetical protein